MLKYFFLVKELVSYSKNLLVLVILKLLKSKISISLLNAFTTFAFILIIIIYTERYLETVRKKVKRFLKSTISLQIEVFNRTLLIL